MNINTKTSFILHYYEVLCHALTLLPRYDKTWTYVVKVLYRHDLIIQYYSKYRERKKLKLKVHLLTLLKLINLYQTFNLEKGDFWMRLALNYLK